ncbi:hypothetical protein PRZ48_012082 [Zasmidium cellare]|uniref:Uncharacterized protein n=1 Tax=Zasmidium cellare TaxID=395010 RepID=A0ABR0E4B9_ZASCE|nr:hypothetical protein PRZ48_012082 [Zasmidium cellare]
MAKNALLVSLFLANAWGSVIGERTTSTCRTEGTDSIAKFDTANSLIGQLLPVFFAPAGTGTYGELRYSGASKVDNEDVVAPAVNAISDPNVAVIGTIGTSLDFLLNRVFGTTVGIANLNPATTITPVAGKVKSFDFKSVWVGCGTTAAQAASLSLPCTVTVTGTDVRGNAKSTETISFGPDQLYNSTLALREFKGWDEMVRVRMAVVAVDIGVPASATNLFFDDLTYCPRYV